ncbi:ABC transporter substrate-binding protein [Actinopolymorpha singaporensis]|uniref:Peptide/nickel transport system substrate-binding protein n=1 Tax=Actinopolymorpha singaporensis TaxID=117157 RepID=A0A1H1TQE0_9ACTN|nr:ABC transporter substrate-binding protein [Actinopolymorpha singaporensis]SDS61779.1 peptide/nickel transport system substrate-binding protein [Actinopolymorpha singaporensis]
MVRRTTTNNPAGENQQKGLTRRSLLYGSAVAAAALSLAGCNSSSGGQEGSKKTAAKSGSANRKGSARKPLAPPSSFKEAPTLAAQVKAGKLPPVEKRLPEKPYVVPHNWLEPGTYGGNVRIMIPATDDGQLKEYMYGHSPLRWLNDGLDIGPGLVESWSSNADASEWTLHFRKGLKWSDGQPWTTADVMFWWEDMVLNEQHSEVPPDEAKSGKGTVMKMTAPDDYTLVMKFDAPAPLTADRLAMWVNRGIGPGWMEPKHYMKQFHPRYNKSVPKDWASADGEFEKKRNWQINPDSPTMTGWRLKSYKEGRQSTWERNPYYWCVDRQGNQLPYVDTLTAAAVQNQEVAKLQIQQGKIDFLVGGFMGVSLSDVSGLKAAQKSSKTVPILWDAGDGTGAAFFFNYDYYEENLRKLIREPKFRQALSLAFNRDDAQKTIYFNTGEKTTGTMSTKAIEYHVDDQGKQVYKQWRDSYVNHDPERAKKILDELGVVDKNGDGKREAPDGSKLIIRLQYASNVGNDYKKLNDLLVRDWKAIGLDARQFPISPEAYGTEWNTGKLMSNSGWGVGDGPNCLVYPQWLVPLEPSRWAPLEGQFYNVRGTPDEHKQKNVDPYKRTPPRMEPEPGGPVARLWKLYDKSKTEVDEMGRHRLVWEMTKIHIEEGPFFQGSVSNAPSVMLAHQELKNVPRKENLAQGGFTAPWIHPTPAVYDPETVFWSNPDQHKG